MSPAPDLLYEVAEVQAQAYEDNLFKEWLTEAEVRAIAMKQGILDPEVEVKLKNCEKTIEDKKIELYETCLTDPVAHKEVKAILGKVKTFQSKLLAQKHAYDHMTLEGNAEYLSQCYLFANLIHDDKKQRLWASYEASDASLLQKVMSEYRSHSLNTEQLREIARTDPWKNLWSAQKQNVFPKGIENDDQRTVVLYSQMYDSIQAHPECPADELVKNDDILDGWLAKNRRKAEQDRMTKQVEDVIPGNIKDGAGEVFVPIKQYEKDGTPISKKDQDKAASQIYGLNDLTGRMTVKQREAFIKRQEQDGEIKADQMPDTKIELTHQAKEQFKSMMRGGGK